MKCTCKDLAALCPAKGAITFSCPEHGTITIDLRPIKTDPNALLPVKARFKRTLAYGGTLPNPGLLQ